MARRTFYPANGFERLLWWLVLAVLSWALLIGLAVGIHWLWCWVAAYANRW